VRQLGGQGEAGFAEGPLWSTAVTASRFFWFRAVGSHLSRDGRAIGGWADVWRRPFLEEARWQI
jgi:hypothetical protein